MERWKLAAVLVFLLVCTVIFRRMNSLGLTVLYVFRHPSPLKWPGPLFQPSTPISTSRAEQASLYQLLNNSNASTTTAALLDPDRTGKSRLELWTEMGCHSPHPLLACTVLDRSKSPDFKVATMGVFRDNRILHARSDSCSLVGSAGWLLKRSYGEDIDSHEVVIRLNGAPIKGFEHYVGRRPADIAMINKALKVCPLGVSNATLILRMYMQITGHKQQTKECMDKYSLPIYHVGRTPYSVGQGIVDQYRRVVTGYDRTSVITKRPLPTAGLMAAMFCLQICKELHLYGFGWNSGDMYAYYWNKTSSKTIHDYYLETTFFKHLRSGEYRNVLKTELPLQGKWKVYWHG